MKRKISLEDVSQRSGISIVTLERYEDGITKKISLEAIKSYVNFSKIFYKIQK